MSEPVAWRRPRLAVGGFAVAVLAVSASLAGCRRPAPPSQVRLAHEAEAISLDPAAVQETATHSILSNIYEPLVAFDGDMRLQPALAEAWNAVDDRTWLIELRKGVLFHDGEELTAEDVKSSLDRARQAPASGIKGTLSTVESIEVVSPHSIKLRTLRPDPIIIVRLSYALIARGFGASERSTRPLGTGPYRFVRWEKGRALEVEAFDGYRAGRPEIDRVSFVTHEESRASVAALREHSVDVLRWVPETMAEEVRALPGIRLLAREGLSTYYLWISTDPGAQGRNPLADRRVRRALSLAIDRQALIRGLGGHGVAASQLVQKGVFGYIATLSELSFDPAEAQRLLAEAGYPRGFEVTLVHRAQASMATVAGLLREMLGRVGVRVALETPDWPAVVSRWTSGRLAFFIGGWRFENGDAATFLRDCLYSRDAERHTGTYNAGYSNRELDRLIDENDQIFGEVNRLKHYERIMQLVMDEMPIVPLYHRLNLYGVSERVRWRPRLDGKLLAAEMSLAPED